MTLTRWQKSDGLNWPSFERLSTFRDEIDRLFDSPIATVARTSQFLNSWAPAIDLYEDKDNFVIKAEVPGVTKEDIAVSLHDGALSISGERKGEEKYQESGVYRAERFLGRFQRTVILPKAVEAEKVKANYKDGVLTVTLPKTEEAKPKPIEIKV
jgi:HSP20 family protein